MSEKTKTSELEERIGLFNAEMTLLQKKYELKLGAEMVYTSMGITAKPVVIDQKEAETRAKVEDNATVSEVVNDEVEKTLDK